jgi:glycine/D-amino acid oxidase-like deaminating enzyme
MWPFRKSGRQVRSADPYWLLRDGLGDARPSTAGTAACDVAIIGAGITGALVADAFAGSGGRVVVLEAHEIGQGSTAASTALLQYEIDTHLADLVQMLGAERAARAYRACLDSLTQLEQRFPELLPWANYERRASLYVAADQASLPALETELAARRAIDIRCEWVGSVDLERRFGCRRPGAILSARAAQIDPLRFTRGVLAGCARHGVEIRTRTRVQEIVERGESFELKFADGGALAAKHVIVCAGFESPQFLSGDYAQLVNTFALVTEPLAQPRWAAGPLIWESARPYLYIRGTPDGRLLVGGADLPFENAVARELLLPKQTRKLARSFEELTGTELPPMAYSWAGTFAETRDGLPYIGAVPRGNPRLQFALCYGGNGITYSVHAGAMLRARVEGRTHALDDVFGFARSEADPVRFVPAKAVRQDSPRPGTLPRQAGAPTSTLPS